MMKSIFDEKFDEGFAAGEAKMPANFLNLRFKRLPKTLSNRLMAFNDKEFEKALR
ncbi:MAG: hypothetical protein FWH27_15685 [Planctomycetaceae bacterium]|nr:hypothetical protein [Planctomycetaceae bacterium]